MGQRYLFEKTLSEAVILKRNSQFTMDVAYQGETLCCHCPATTRIGDIDVSKLDFLVGNTYLEVKSPLTTLNVKYGSHIKTKKIAPFSSTDRFQKHIQELAGSLKSHERAILLTVNQYVPTEMKPHLKSTHYAEVSHTMKKALNAGIETWNIDLQFKPNGVGLINLRETSKETKNY